MGEKYWLKILKNLYFVICNSEDKMKANKAIASVADVLYSDIDSFESGGEK